MASECSEGLSVDYRAVACCAVCMCVDVYAVLDTCNRNHFILIFLNVQLDILQSWKIVNLTMPGLSPHSLEWMWIS